jgi:hypothetical protein
VGVSTAWIIERRRYFFLDYTEGVGSGFERYKREPITRVLTASYWWPEHEGREWPAAVVVGPEWGCVGEEPDAWSHFEQEIGMDGRFRCEALSIFTPQ